MHDILFYNLTLDNLEKTRSNQILQITFNEYQNEIIQLQKQIIELYQILKML
jgi:hypothetical protein